MPNRVSAFALGGALDQVNVKAEWQKRRDMARESVMNMFRTARGGHEMENIDVYLDMGSDSDEDERLGPRPVIGKIKSLTTSTTPSAEAPHVGSNHLTIRPIVRRPSSRLFKNEERRAALPKMMRSASVPPEVLRSPVPQRGLDAEDVIYMFAGAPYFDVAPELARPEPRIVFGWGPAYSRARDTTDYQSFTHKSFQVCTADEKHMNESPTSRKRQCRVRERPCMLSAQGKDLGTVGFTYYLESQLDLGKPNVVAEKRRQHNQRLLVLDPALVGLQKFDIEDIMDRVAELTDVYSMLCNDEQHAKASHDMIETIGEDLFTTLLSPDLGLTPAGTGSISLLTQITALQKVLVIDHMWFDFSQGSWRARLHQLMWQPNEVADLTDDDSSIPVNERDVLMLQIALSAELAIRLELAYRLAAINYSRPGIFAPEDLHIILAAQTEALEWSMILFQRFARSFAAEDLRPDDASTVSRQTPSDGMHRPDLVFILQAEQQQESGLQAFAKQLDWPDLDYILAQSECRRTDSYFEDPGMHRPTVQYSSTAAASALLLVRSQKALVLHPSFDGFISATEYSTSASKSWLSGFILPGTSASHALMHALLEATPAAHRLLSEPAYMSDGFVYNRNMYWSKDSIAGRVLASMSEARECMGWISLPFVPRGQDDGWMRVLTKNVAPSRAGPRLNRPGRIAKSSDPLHASNASSLSSEDFKTVVDGPSIMGNEARLDGVSLAAANQSQYIPEDFTASRMVNLTFASGSGKLPSLTVPLTHAVSFVASCPCFAHVRRPAELSPASEGPRDSCASTPSSGHEKDLPLPPVHPLHKGFDFTVVPAATLLSYELRHVNDDDALELLAAQATKGSKPTSATQRVIVLDCRGQTDLEVLARAWCSKVGKHAIVGQLERTCMACCIREAYGLGIEIVIRIL